MSFPLGAVAVRRAFFGMGRSDQIILMDDVSCSGEESTLLNCSHVQTSDCDHSEDAGVICSGNFDMQIIFLSQCNNIHVQGRA